MITRIGVSHYRQIAGGQKIELVHPSQENQEPTAAYAAGLWGANSIGKSALVDALDWLQAATSSRHPNWWPPVPRSATARPTTVSVDILVEQQHYQYSLATDEHRIVHETLCIDDTDDQKQPDNMVFERGAAGVKLGKKLRARAPDQELLGRLEVDPSSTMLLAASLLGQPHCATLQREIETISILRPLTRMDDALRTTIQTCSTPGADDSPAGIRRRIAAALLDNAGIDLKERRDVPCTNVAERIQDAGEGARRAASIAGPAAVSLSNGGLLVIDPIDAGIHGLWQESLIQAFSRQPKDRNRPGQLLFTTGSTDLIETLAPDQVWIADGKPEGTEFHSLADYDESDASRANRRRRYHAGRYGGTPEAAPIDLQRACRDAFAIE